MLMALIASACFDNFRKVANALAFYLPTNRHSKRAGATRKSCEFRQHPYSSDDNHRDLSNKNEVRHRCGYKQQRKRRYGALASQLRIIYTIE
jgi:hypothetical protein